MQTRDGLAEKDVHRVGNLFLMALVLLAGLPLIGLMALLDEDRTPLTRVQIDRELATLAPDVRLATIDALRYPPADGMPARKASDPVTREVLAQAERDARARIDAAEAAAAERRRVEDLQSFQSSTDGPSRQTASPSP